LIICNQGYFLVTTLSASTSADLDIIGNNLRGLIIFDSFFKQYIAKFYAPEAWGEKAKADAAEKGVSMNLVRSGKRT